MTEGERWTREQLELLLAARFTPPAVARFLVASQQRSSAVRRSRPDLARQERLWTAAGFVAWALPAGLGVEPFRSRARAGVAWWGACALMLDWHLGMLETEDGRPRPLGAADALTLTRAWMAPLALASPSPALLGAGYLSDALDGPAARLLGEPTRAGRDLEGLADLCFAAGALAGLRRRDEIGRLASVAELARLGAGFTFAFVAWFAQARAPDRELIGAARVTTPARALGVLAAAAGRRRLGTALVACGCAASLALEVRALAAEPRAPA